MCCEGSSSWAQLEICLNLFFSFVVCDDIRSRDDNHPADDECHGQVPRDAQQRARVYEIERSASRLIRTGHGLRRLHLGHVQRPRYLHGKSSEENSLLLLLLLACHFACVVRAFHFYIWRRQQQQQQRVSLPFIPTDRPTYCRPQCLFIVSVSLSLSAVFMLLCTVVAVGNAKNAPPQTL